MSRLRVPVMALIDSKDQESSVDVGRAYSAPVRNPASARARQSLMFDMSRTVFDRTLLEISSRQEDQRECWQHGIRQIKLARYRTFINLCKANNFGLGAVETGIFCR